LIIGLLWIGLVITLPAPGELEGIAIPKKTLDECASKEFIDILEKE